MLRDRSRKQFETNPQERRGDKGLLKVGFQDVVLWFVEMRNTANKNKKAIFFAF